MPKKFIKKTKPESETIQKKPIENGAKPKKVPALLRGMKDILPKEEVYWKKTYHTAEALAAAYDFGRIDTPILEEASLFIRSIGRGTDVVDKEMYVFEDKDGSKICLRPEGTASICRAFVSHGMHVWPQPVKLWYWGPMFRHDRPQAGRYRQFHQFTVETLGVHDPVVDAELISVTYNFLRDLGIDAIVHLNSIGNAADRERYIIELVAYLRSKRAYLSEESKKRIHKNPLRVLDSKEEKDQAILNEAPQIIDWLCEESRQYFMKVLEYLDEANIPYTLQPRLVRGLDYYTDTVFEFYQTGVDVASQNALGGGGRYDLLVEQLGGQPTPAAGVSMGLERVIAVLKEKAQVNPDLVKEERPKIFFAHLGEQSRRRALALIEELRRDGILLNHALSKTSLKTQLEVANKYAVTHTLILGQKELLDGTIIVRDMASGIQEIIDQKKIKKELQRILAIHA